MKSQANKPAIVNALRKKGFNKQSAKNIARAMRRDRLRKIATGEKNPETPKEWAIWHKEAVAISAKRIKDLHDQSAINIPSTMAGKIVVIPPPKN